jgi:hypothetical protein
MDGSSQRPRGGAGIRPGGRAGTRPGGRAGTHPPRTRTIVDDVIGDGPDNGGATAANSELSRVWANSRPSL